MVRNLLFLPPQKKHRKGWSVNLPPDPDPRRPFAPKFRQDLVELYAAGEEPRPDVNECHRSMRGADPYGESVVRFWWWGVLLYKIRIWLVVSKMFYFQPDPWGNDPIWLIFFKWVVQPPTRYASLRRTTTPLKIDNPLEGKNKNHLPTIDFQGFCLFGSVAGRVYKWWIEIPGNPWSLTRFTWKWAPEKNGDEPNLQFPSWLRVSIFNRWEL